MGEKFRSKEQRRADRERSQRMFDLMEEREPAIYQAATRCLLFAGLTFILLGASIFVVFIKDAPFWPGALGPLLLGVAAMLLNYKYVVYVQAFEEKYREVIDRG